MTAVILAVIALGLVLWRLGRKRWGRGRSQSWQRTRPSLGRAQGVPPRLMNELHRLTRDQRLSARLIERIAFNNPERSRRWCVEKAIYDLQRDRRS